VGGYKRKRWGLVKPAGRGCSRDIWTRKERRGDFNNGTQRGGENLIKRARRGKHGCMLKKGEKNVQPDEKTARENTKLFA